MLKCVVSTLKTLPDTTKLPVTVISPEIVPPEELSLVLAAAKAEFACVLANVSELPVLAAEKAAKASEKREKEKMKKTAKKG